MAPVDRCDEIIRRIDEALADCEPLRGPETTPTGLVVEQEQDERRPLGTWGVLHLPGPG